MDPCCRSWIALPPEHVGRGTPAISGGAVFFSFCHFTEFKGFSFQGMLILRWSWVQIPSGTHFLVMGSNPAICNCKFLVTKYPHSNQM